MTEWDARLDAANAALDEARFDEAVTLFTALFHEAERCDGPGDAIHFMTMFGWQRLVEAYPPAAAALPPLRDAQVQHLLAGDLFFGPPRGPAPGDDPPIRRWRFSIIVALNRLLHDDRATADVFARLDATRPDLARRYSRTALPTVVAAGELMLADRYRGDPLAHLPELISLTSHLPLFPVPHAAPRLAATLTNLVSDVRVGMAVLAGTGRLAAAQALRASLLAGLADGAVRSMAERELDQPGTILRDIVARQMEQESAAQASSAQESSAQDQVP